MDSCSGLHGEISFNSYECINSSKRFGSYNRDFIVIDRNVSHVWIYDTWCAELIYRISNLLSSLTAWIELLAFLFANYFYFLNTWFILKNCSLKLINICIYYYCIYMIYDIIFFCTFYHNWIDRNTKLNLFQKLDLIIGI